MDKDTIYFEGDPTEIHLHSEQTDYISKMIRRSNKFYEHELLTFIRDNFKQLKTVIDIGANLGNHSLFFAKYVDCAKVVSFEPMEKNFQVFKKNLEKYSNKCQLHTYALSDKIGKMTVYNTENNNFGGFSLHKQNGSFEVKKEVDVFTLDNFSFINVSLIKIDVENHENEVLKGARQTIARNQPIIILENSYYYFSNSFPNPNPHAEVMQELGYEKIFSNVCGSAMDIWGPKK